MNAIRILTSLNLFLIASCTRPVCTNTNPVFDQFQPGDKAYTDELAKQLKIADNESLKYWFDGIEQSGGLTYLHIHVTGASLCAKMIVVVKGESDKLCGLIKSEGKGYSGAELKDLTYFILEKTPGTEFIFKDMGSVGD